MSKKKFALAFAGVALLSVGCSQQVPEGVPSPTTASSSAVRSTPSAAASTRSASATATAPNADGTNTPRSEQPSQTPSPTPSAAASSTEAAPLLQQGSVGLQVRELQARLRQLKLYSGYDVTDTYGPITAQGVSAYQTDQGFTATGNVDQKTWDALVAATKTPSQAELNNQIAGAAVVGQGSSSDDIKDVQFRLAQVTGYQGGTSGQWSDAVTQAVKDFQTKQVIPVNGAVDQRTYDRLVSNTRAASPWELNGTKAPTASDGATQTLDPRCMTGRVICGSMSQRKVSWVVDGKIIVTMDARYGSTEFPTNPGVFHVYYKDANLVSHLYGDVPMPYSICFDQSRCVHFSQDFVTLGWGNASQSYGSHGCINVRDYNTEKWLFSQVNLGDTVVVY